MTVAIRIMIVNAESALEETKDPTKEIATSVRITTLRNAKILLGIFRFPYLNIAKR